MAQLRIIMLLAVVLLVGCKGGDAMKVDAPKAAPAAESAKSILNEIAQSGELGSGVMTLRENLQACEEGKALLPDMDALEKLSDPAQIKAKAKEMAGKL